MLEKFTYTNNFNEVLEFGKDNLFVNENDLRDFAWEITSRNDKISGFKKGIVSKTIPVILKCDTEEDGILLRNRLFEVFEKDVLAGKHGKIQIGDYYMRCYITGSKKTQYLINDSYMLISLTVQTDLPAWIKETTLIYNQDIEIIDTHLDYPYDFAYDFKNGITTTKINNNDFVDSNFVITIFGYVENPTLYIGGHRYTVNTTVDLGEYLTIDSVNKTIVLTKATDGEQVNCFNERGKDSYIFKKIPVGESDITSPNPQISFSITLLEERSEPRWILKKGVNQSGFDLH